MSAETLVRVRMVVYILLSLLWIFYTIGVVVDIERFSRCLYSPLDAQVCSTEGYRSSLNPSELINTDDYQWSSKETYINSEGRTRNLANQSTGYFVQILILFISFYVSSTLSLIVVWLVDHREAPNGFTRLIQWFCAFQVLMDLGFFCGGFTMSAGYYKLVTYGAMPNQTVVPHDRSDLYDFSEFLLAIGDEGSVMFTTVLAYTFFQIARTQAAIDITKYLLVGVSISVGVGMLIAVLQLGLCRSPSWKYECTIIEVRGWISVICIAINIYYGVRVSMLLKAMKAGKRKDAISALASRIRFYAGWVAFSRIGYIGLTLSTGTLNLDFADAKHTRLMNVLSSLTYLMWLPTGTGFAIYYLYTHPDELKYFCDLCRRVEGVSFLPRDLCELYNRMMVSCCGFCCTSRYPAIEGDDHNNESNNEGIDGGDPEEGGSSTGTGNKAAGGLGRIPGTSTAGNSLDSNGENNTINPIQASGSDSSANSGGSGLTPFSRISVPAGSCMHLSESVDGSFGDNQQSSKPALSTDNSGSDAMRMIKRGSDIPTSASYGRGLNRQQEDILMLDACLLGEEGDSAVLEERARGENGNGSMRQSLDTANSTGTSASGNGTFELGVGVRDSRGEGAMPIQRSMMHSEV
jgi:hypothetical protein